MLTILDSCSIFTFDVQDWPQPWVCGMQSLSFISHSDSFAWVIFKWFKNWSIELELALSSRNARRGKTFAYCACVVTWIFYNGSRFSRYVCLAAGHACNDVHTLTHREIVWHAFAKALVFSSHGLRALIRRLTMSSANCLTNKPCIFASWRYWCKRWLLE